jgi:hypothetical protein
MLTARAGEMPRMFRLDIDAQTVTQWQQDIVDSRDDLSDVESANEVLSELSGLCAPLVDPTVSTPEELLILCIHPVHQLSGAHCKHSYGSSTRSWNGPTSPPRRSTSRRNGIDESEKRTNRICFFGLALVDLLCLRIAVIVAIKGPSWRRKMKDAME